MRLKHRQYGHWMLDCEDELNAAQGCNFIHITWISQASPWNPETPEDEFRTKRTTRRVRHCDNHYYSCSGAQ